MEQFPAKVRCVNCGQLAQFADEEDGDGYTAVIYDCDGCEWETHWEIVYDGDGGILSSSLYYYSLEHESALAWYDCRDWPGFWMPDGLIVPDEALKPLEQAEVRDG